MQQCDSDLDVDGSVIINSHLHETLHLKKIRESGQIRRDNQLIKRQN